MRWHRVLRNFEIIFPLFDAVDALKRKGFAVKRFIEDFV
jgi:hypothetical protein